jgi:23S rRNA (cytidine2498-2'-O)-methyltransferase
MNWLVRTPEVFAEIRMEVFAAMGAAVRKEFGDYRLVELPDGVSPRDGAGAMFVSWCLPVQHAWPCDPRKMDGFVEKAATGLQRKFAAQNPAALWVGAMEAGPADGWFKRLASNVRGRALQLLPGAAVPLAEAGGQDPAVPALFCLVGKFGLYAGMVSPGVSNGFYPGGVRFLPKSSDKTISRAGAKVAEALHHGRLFGEPPGEGAHWLELGASPGGMTAELLGRGARVTAIDRAALDERLQGARGLTFVRRDVAGFQPAEGVRYDALLCDMNDDPEQAFAQVMRLSEYLHAGAWLVFTLKTTGSEGFSDLVELHARVATKARQAGLVHLGTSHLSGNRREFTMWFVRG